MTDFEIMAKMSQESGDKIQLCKGDNVSALDVFSSHGSVTIGMPKDIAVKIHTGEMMVALYVLDKKEFARIKRCEQASKEMNDFIKLVMSGEQYDVNKKELSGIINFTVQSESREFKEFRDKLYADMALASGISAEVLNGSTTASYNEAFTAALISKWREKNEYAQSNK